MRESGIAGFPRRHNDSAISLSRAQLLTGTQFRVFQAGKITNKVLSVSRAQLLTGTQAVEGSSALSASSMCAALAAMFPSDLAPLIDVSGKRYAHTVRAGRSAGPPVS